ncbi:MAG: hydrogenase accessory protein HypA [Desulfobacterales bacterium GWB2_56_26]|nr:MAG: hydrogenase accessory protein HypA [Desulfobacterales bacterium GWB2_56_26]HBG19222.1 hydrogenase accessory protein HypA [Desulfobulbaceae bacterium]
MHEISLVQGLLQQLSDLAAENEASKILSVTMEIGPQSGIVADSFRFGFEILAAESELVKGANLIIETPAARYACTQCGHVVETADGKPDGCPACGDLLLFPQGGDDLILRQVEME